MQRALLPLVHALFSETSPIPIKAALAAVGVCDEELRLPLVPMQSATREKLYEAMRGAGLRV